MRVLLTDMGTGVLPDGCIPRAELVVGGRTLRFGMLERPDIVFRPEADYNRHYVLVRVLTFSLTDGDRAALGGEAPPASRGEFGTDFVGEVVSAGSDVPLSVGDRVVPVACWPPRRADTVSGLGLAAGASAQLRRIHHAHLMRVPTDVEDTVAAVLPTAAISAYAVVRRAELRPGTDVLVTAATTPTGRVVVQAARRQDAVVHVVAGQGSNEAELLAELGAQQVFALGTPAQTEEIVEYAKKVQGFDVVIDPDGGAQLTTAIRLCGFGARCVVGHRPPGVPDAVPAPASALLESLVAKHVTLLGQRLGEPADLAAAMADVRQGALTTVIDRSFLGDQDIAPFVSRALSPDRAGGVTYTFEKE